LKGQHNSSLSLISPSEALGPAHPAGKEKTDAKARYESYIAVGPSDPFH
jgi:hypothetical protein